MTPIAIKYRLSLPEFMAACNAHWIVHKQGSRTNLILAGVAILSGLAILPFDTWGALLIALGVVLLFLVIGRSILWRSAFRDTKKFSGEISVTFGDEKIHVETIDAVADLNWSVYNSYLDTPEYILLYMTRRTFSVIPKSAFPDVNAQRDFMNLVGTKLSQIK